MTGREYKFWIAGGLIKKTLLDWEISPTLIGVTVFVVYWVLPMISCFYNGTLFPATAEFRIRFEESFSLMQVISGFIDIISDDQKLTRARDVGYFNDTTHFIFSIIIAIGAWAASKILIQINSSLNALRDNKVLPLTQEKIFEIYEENRIIANHRNCKIFAGIISTIVGIVFVTFCHNIRFSNWWGYHSHGFSGYTLALIEIGMVYWGVQVVYFIAAGSNMYAKVFSQPIILHPFHPDGSNGLSPAGMIIVYFWIFSLLVAAAIFTTLYFGYLGIEKYLVTWILALSGTVLIPLIAIRPLLAAVKAAEKYQKNLLSKYQYTLERSFDEIFLKLKVTRHSEIIILTEKYNSLLAFRQSLLDINIWPFNPKALGSLVVLYVVQSLLIVKEVITLL